MAIKTFQHKGLKRFFEAGSKAGITLKHATKIALILDRLDAAEVVNDMNFPGRFSSLKRKFKRILLSSRKWKLGYYFSL
jgi:plasmid maintenance system killer protein